jgi:HlyD family secretion protein
MTVKPNSDSDIHQVLEMDRSSVRKAKIRRWLILSVLAIATVAGVVFYQRGGKAGIVQYKTQEAERGNLTLIVTATGTLQPTNKVDVSSELSGIIQSVEVDYNDKVKVGQTLARLNPSKLEAQVTQSKAALKAARARVLQAQATVSETRSKLDQFQNVRKLSNNKIPSQTEFDAAIAAFERAKADQASAEAAVSQAVATLEANQTDFSKLVIRSPINGIVLNRSVEPGQTVASSFQAPVLFTLAEDLTQMELLVNVDEADVGKVSEGQKATFSVAAYPHRVFEAWITQTRYGSSTLSGVVTYETVLKVTNSDLSLRPGMTATADITVRQIENAILIPNGALHFTPPRENTKSKPSRGLVAALLPRPPRPSSNKPTQVAKSKKEQHIWTLQDGQLTAISVTVGETDGKMTEMLSGNIKPGIELVVEIIASKN